MICRICQELSENYLAFYLPILQLVTDAIKYPVKCAGYPYRIAGKNPGFSTAYLHTSPYEAARPRLKSSSAKRGDNNQVRYLVHIGALTQSTG
jgi:hypothetical protein